MHPSSRNWLRSGAIGASVLAMSFAGPVAQAQDEVNWTMATYASGHWLDIGMNNFVKRVEQLTDGRVKIAIAQPGTLGSPLKVTETVQNGIAEVGHNWAGYDWGVDSAGVVFGGWAGGLTPEEQFLWLFNEGGAEMLAEWRDEKFNVVSIPCASVETEIFLHSHKPIRTLEDFKGLRMRTAGAWAEIASSLGASTVVLPGDEVFSALERGVVDAIEWAGPGQNLAAGFNTIAEYIITPGIHQPSSLQECIFNKDAWAEISESDHELIRVAGRLNMLDTFLAYAEFDLEGWKKLHEAGKNQFVTLDPSFIEAAHEASMKWGDAQAEKNPWFKRAYESQRALQDKLGSWLEFRIPIGATKTGQ